MKLKSITIKKTEGYRRREGVEYEAIAEVEGGSYYDNITITVDPEQTAKIVDILAFAVADAMARAAGEFASDIKARIAGPAIENATLDAPAADA